jgi:hypothetical protein
VGGRRWAAREGNQNSCPAFELGFRSGFQLKNRSSQRTARSVVCQCGGGSSGGEGVWRRLLRREI